MHFDEKISKFEFHDKMDDSESGLDISTVNTVETPVGTPSPPNAASTVARPPPRPRRLPHINFLEDAVEGKFHFDEIFHRIQNDNFLTNS